MTGRAKVMACLGGAGLLAASLAVRAAAHATGSAVFFAGHELRWACPLKLLSGVACPACGMTRSVVLTLGGDVSGALELNPGGPLLVLGLLLTGALLLLSPLVARLLPDLPRRLRRWTSAYAAALAAVLLARWMLAMV